MKLLAQALGAGIVALTVLFPRTTQAEAVGAPLEEAHHVEPPKPAPITVVREGGAALREVLIHYVPEEEDRIRDTYRDFLGTLPLSTRIVAVHGEGQRDKLDTFLEELAPAAASRTQRVEGASEGDVPRHHMSMYMAALDDKTVLVGDPAAGSAIVGPGFMPGERGVESRELLVANESPGIQARFDRAAHKLSLAGFTVVRVPTIVFEDKTYFAYTDGVYETRDGKKVAWIPSFATGDDPLVADLDSAARAVYQKLGYEVRPVTVRKLFTSHGTLGGVVKVLSRE